MIIDALGRQVPLNDAPRRIVSLCPSQTELLFDLGAGEQVVGITKFCVHPADGVREKKRVGGTKKVDYDSIRGLNPDLVIAQKEENTPEMVETLARLCPVYVTDVVDIDSALQMIEQVGALVGREGAAREIVAEIQGGLDGLAPLPYARVLYLIWREPWMAAGRGTFIHSVLGACGFDNVLDLDRYPTLSVDQMRVLAPDVVFLSSEPYPFKERHLHEVAGLVAGARVHLVDGEVFSWYGSRMRSIPGYARELRRFFGEDRGPT